MKRFWHDCVIGFRNLRRYPKYSVVVLLTMILGVSVTTTMYSLTSQVVLQPLPVAEPHQLVSVYGKDSVTGADSPYEWVDFTLYQQWQDLQLQSLDLAFFTFESSAITEQDIPVYATNLIVSPNFLSLLGVQPLLGRWFDANDVGKNAIVLAYDVWVQQFSSDPDIVGKTISVQKSPHTVLGVMPENFAKFIASTAGIYQPVDDFYRGGDIIGRLKTPPESSQSVQYQDALTSVANQSVPNVSVGFLPLQEQITKSASSNLWLLMAGVVALLLVAILNVINLTFAYYNNRLHELSIRVSLGATKARLMQYLLIENLLIALVVGLVSIFFSKWLLDFVLSLVASSLPRHEEVHIDLSAWVFSFLLALIAAILAALIPSSKIVKPEKLIDSIKQGSGRSAGTLSSLKLRKSLISIEVGFALILLIVVGLLAKSYTTLLKQETGFKPDNIVTGHIWAPDNFTRKERGDYFEAVLREIRQIPGVSSAAATSTVPFGPRATRVDFEEAYTYSGQQVLPSGGESRVFMRTVSDNYFNVLGVPLLKGRFFDERDKSSNLPVAIINKSMAELNWQNEDPVGKIIEIPRWGEEAAYKVIGVVRDVRHRNLDSKFKPEMFLSTHQIGFGGSTFAVKSENLNANRLAREMSRASATVDNSVPMIQLHTLPDLIDQSVAKQRSLLQILLGFSLLTVLLAMVGIYGLSNYLIGQRTSEVAVRMAVGAKPRAIRMLILKDSLMPVIIGVVLGLVATVILARLISSFLFGVAVWDGLTYLGATLIILIVGLLAPIGPALRAARISPCAALHHQ